MLYKRLWYQNIHVLLYRKPTYESTNSSFCMHLYLLNTVNAKLNKGNFALLIISRLHIITSVSGTHPAPYAMSNGSSLPRVQCSGREPDHSSQSSPEFKYHWIYVSTPHTPLCREQSRICLFDFCVSMHHHIWVLLGPA